jgi:ketosteroid isomerase-like protein
MSFVTVRDGKITEGWDCWDYGALTATLSSPMV